MSIQLFSLFFTLSAFAISANAVPPLISTLAEGFGVGASNFGFFITLQFVFFSLASFVGGWVKERLRLTNWHLVTAGLILIVAAFFAGTVLLRSALSLVLWVVPLGLAGGAVETFSSIEISAASDPGSRLSYIFESRYPSVVVDVTHNEILQDGGGEADWLIEDDGSVWLRAEREGAGTGRIYTITVTATDDASNTATAAAMVSVPHDRGD